MDQIKKKIESYVCYLLHQHDMSIGRNENNKNAMYRIVAKCIKDLEKHEGLIEALENEKQIEYFVRQTILYMI